MEVPEDFVSFLPGASLGMSADIGAADVVADVDDAGEGVMPMLAPVWGSMVEAPKSLPACFMENLASFWISVMFSVSANKIKSHQW